MLICIAFMRPPVIALADIGYNRHVQKGDGKFFKEQYVFTIVDHFASDKILDCQTRH